jgi:hypothetical protein
VIKKVENLVEAVAAWKSEVITVDQKEQLTATGGEYLVRAVKEVVG